MRVPRQIVTDLSSLCNLSCTYCPNSYKNYDKYGKRGYMDVRLYKSIVDRIVKERINTSITACLLGESMLHPNIVELMKYTIDNNVAGYLTTNTTIWNQELFEVITEKNSIYQLILSVNGMWGSGSNEKYMKGIREKESRQLIENVIRMRNAKDKSNLEIGIKIIERGQDYEEIENLIYYWLEYGADFVAIGKPLINYDNGSRNYPCRHSDDMAMYVRSDGVILPCGWNVYVTNEHAYDMGVLDKTTPLLEIYNNEKYLIFRKLHYEKNYPEVCKKCGIAYTGDGIIGQVQFRDTKKMRKKMYYHEDYSNAFYSYKEKYTRISFLRDWKKDATI